MDVGLRSDGVNEGPNDLFGHELVPRAAGKSPTQMQMDILPRVLDQEKFTFIRFHHWCNHFLQGVFQFVIGHGGYVVSLNLLSGIS